MKNLDSIPHILNGIFRELNTATNVKVTLHEVPGTRQEAPGKRHEAPGKRQEAPGTRHEASSDPVIQTVNGCQSPEQFYHMLFSLCATARCTIAETLRGLEPTEKATLLLEAFHRTNSMKDRVTSMILPSKPGDPNYPCLLYLQAFTHITLIPSHTSTPILQMHPFACQLKKALSILSHQLISMAILHEHHRDICVGGTPQPSQPPPFKKLPIRASVPYSAVLARIFFDNGLFAIKNKSEFCRIFASLISTNQQEEVSPLSLRNHFNNPPPEILALIDARLSEWRSYIRKLMALN